MTLIMYYALAAILLVTAVLALCLVLIHAGFRAPRRVEEDDPSGFGMAFEEVSISNGQGSRLFAWYLPTTADAPTLVLLHGWGSNAGLMLPLAQPFFRAGLNILLLDARNHGRSESAGHSSLPRFAEDLEVAIDWLKGRKRGQIILLGHSVGAGAVLLAASRRGDIAGVISLSAFAHPEAMMRRQLAPIPLPERLVGWILRYVEWVIGHRFDEIAPMNTAPRVSCPLLLVHGQEDRTVPPSDALAIRANCAQDGAELLLIEGAGHDSVEKIGGHAERLVDFFRQQIQEQTR